ncbi:MAG: sugar porter family MFS transporter [Pseudomonadota bacterium]
MLLLVIVLAAALCGFLFGFDEGVVSGAFPFMKQSFTFTSFSQGLMASAVPLGAFAGAFFAATQSDRVGRRKVIMASALLFVIGLVGSTLAPSVAMLTAARLLIGVAVGMAALVAPQYLAEVAPPDIRGRVIGTFQFMIVIGILFAYLSDLGFASLDVDRLDEGGLRWRLMFAVGVVPAVILLVGMLRAPESPRWLAMKGQREKAGTVLADIQPGIAEHVLNRTLDEMMDHEAEGKGPGLAALFRPGMRRLTVFAMLAFVMQQLSGINAVIFYAPQIFESLQFSNVTAQLTATVGVGVVNLLGTIVALVILDRIGRRTLFMIGFAGTGLAMALIVAVFLTPAEWDNRFSLLGVFGFIAFFAVSLGPLPWIYMSELFPTELRSKGMMVAAMTNWIATFLIVLLFPIAAGAFGMLVTFSAFCVFCVAGFFFALFFAPETRGIPLEELTDRLTKPAQ